MAESNVVPTQSQSEPTGTNWLDEVKRDAEYLYLKRKREQEQDKEYEASKKKK